MVLILVAAALVLAVAFYQVIQGLFSAVIMAILSILSAALAFSLYEPLARALLYTRQPAYADSVALMALFFVPLLVMRLLFDRFLRGNVVAGVWTDRIGGGLLGLLTGMILVGMLMICAQMLPFGETVLTYRPFDDELRRDQRLAPFYPDEFVAGLAKHLSAASLSGDRTFGSDHDDLVLEAFCARNTAGQNGRTDALPGQLIVKGAYEPELRDAPWSSEVPADPLDKKATRIVAIQVTINESTRDKDDWWRVIATHFRLVCQEGRSVYPVALMMPGADKLDLPKVEDGQPQIATLIAGVKWSDGVKALKFNCIYRLRKDETPSYLVFRRVARAAIGKIKTLAPPGIPALPTGKSGRRR